MTTEHRKAPRRDVVEISREGAWGKVKYQHLLSCGHTEARARAATSPKLACAWCLRADEKDSEIKALSAGAIPSYVDTNEQSAEEEITVNRVRATIAARFKIPLDAIDIVVADVNGNLIIKNALVFLSSSDVARLSKPKYDE